MRHFRLLINFLLASSLLLSVLFSTVYADTHQNALLHQDQEGEPEPRIAHHSQTGYVNFIGANPDNPIVLRSATGKSLSAEDKALVALNEYGPIFGLRDPISELLLFEKSQSASGRSSTRYLQTHNGIPIIGGELFVNMDANGGLLSINGEISPQLAVPVIPKIPTATAQQTATEAVSKWYELTVDDVETTPPELWIYDARLLQNSTEPPSLVWRMDVFSMTYLHINEFVLIDAISGGISLHFNQVDNALVRKVYDNENDSGRGLPGYEPPERIEGGGPTGNADIDLAYDYSGDTYDFYSTRHGRDSLDDAGRILVSTVRYCNLIDPCPYANAFWRGDPYYQMAYGQGYASADDVVGHELTHGVTEFESNLFYYYQSGAINESFSDIWGEFIDLTNGAGNDDPSVRWLMGEDLPIGAIRDMSDPSRSPFRDPDRMTSIWYYTGSGDSGGVHANSGVNNKAAYLMVDGGTFNGKTVTALGINKTAAVYYEVQTNLLTSGSDYADLYQLLFQGCLNLVGGSAGITVADCVEVRDASDAVEMNLEPSQGFNPEADVCADGKVPQNLFMDDLESGTGNWTFRFFEGPNAWEDTTGYASSGLVSLYGYDFTLINDSYAALTSSVSLPVGNPGYLRFKHAFAFEVGGFPSYYKADGGWLEYSLDGGSNWYDAGSMIDSGLDYNGSISVPTDNPNAGHVAYIDKSHGYVSTRLDLSSHAGESIKFRWRVSTDSGGRALGWVVDDVQIYTCNHALFLPLASK